MREIDWSKAPEGATHISGAGVWLRENDSGILSAWDSGKWYGLSRTVPEYIQARPAEPWDGTGLPPVGTVCEFRWDGGSWRKVTVFATKPLASGGKCALFDIGDNDWSFSNSPQMFRPIKTPEQIAAEEREEAIDEMVQFFMNYYGNPKGAESYLLICRSLHDAGWRKNG